MISNVSVSNKNFIDYSCLVVAVLSHGEEKNKVSAKDQYYDFDETVVNPISKNITLLGCPKIFIINACRGYERNVYVSDDRYPEMEVDSCVNCTPAIEKMRTIPYMKEILKLYSCYEGKKIVYSTLVILLSQCHTLRICVISKSIIRMSVHQQFVQAFE